MKILLVEDDPRISEHVKIGMEMAGFAVDTEADGENAWFRGETEDYDLIILDLGLPQLDGLTMLKRWRKADVNVPILILTARGNWDERVEGIDAGADDYLTKPFRIEEVVARARALVRRAAGHSQSSIEIGDLLLDTRQMRVSRKGLPVALSAQEYRLVAYLMLHRGRVVPQIELTEHMYAQDFERDSNAIEVLVGRVRRKLGSDAIETRRGFGYLMGGDAS